MHSRWAEQGEEKHQHGKLGVTGDSHSLSRSRAFMGREEGRLHLKI